VFQNKKFERYFGSTGGGLEKNDQEENFHYFFHRMSLQYKKDISIEKKST